MVLQHDIGAWFTIHTYEKLDQESVEELTEAARILATRILSITPQGNEQLVAISKTREALFWAVEAIACRQ